MCGEITHETEPCASDAARYSELLAIYREVYPQLRETFSKLARFTRGA